jgi:Domain of unknown function (DUF4919)
MRRLTVWLFGIIFVMSFYSCSTFSTNKNAVDFGLIESIVSNPDTNLYYPSLMKRLKEKDTTLTKNEFHHLYYGYVFQDEYNKLSIPKRENEYIELMKKPVLLPEDTLKVINICEDMVSEFPFFSLRYYSMLSYFYGLTGNKDLENYYGLLVWKFYEAIMSSGSGNTDEDPTYVIYIRNEYDILALDGLQMTSQALTTKGQDCLSLAPNKYDIDRLYFDVNITFSQGMRKFREK